jgi:hypothetical protein
MSELVDSLLNQLQGQHTQQLSRELGTDPDKTQSAIGALLPVIVAAMQKKAAQPGGTQDLQSILAKMAGGMMGGGMTSTGQASPRSTRETGPSSRQEDGIPDLGGLIGSMLNRPSQPSVPSGGGGASDGDLLSEIFGGQKQQSRVTQGVGKATGVDAGAVDVLLKKLGPVVAGALASKAKSQNMNDDQLGGYLNRERDAVHKRNDAESTLIGMLLDQDGDGDFDSSDMLALGAKLIFGSKKLSGT